MRTSSLRERLAPALWALPLVLVAACAGGDERRNGGGRSYSSAVVTSSAGKASRRWHDDDLICERVQVVGSHLPTWQCLTVRERNEARLRARDTLDDLQEVLPRPDADGR